MVKRSEELRQQLEELKAIRDSSYKEQVAQHGYGRDELTTEVSMQDAKSMRKCYDKNEKGVAHRIIKRRVKKEV